MRDRRFNQRLNWYYLKKENMKENYAEFAINY